jgi:DNA-binding helix-turn-helix protein|nr:MAG TPA: helix-turn-helix domain protein [Caudoviricetes sp.]
MLDKEMKIDKKEVGRRIKQIRTNKGFTLESFGKLFGASKSNVQKWENGISLPNKDRLYNISKIAGVTVNELLYGNIEKDVEELYQRLIKLPRDEFINLMMRVSIEFESEGE